MYVRKLPSGKWSCVVRHPSGRRVSKSDPLKRVVMDWGRAKESEFRTGQVPVERLTRLTVGQWCERWLAARSVEPTTARKDRTRLENQILPKWRDWPMQSIGRIDVAAWVADMNRAGVGPHAVQGSYRLLSNMLTDAVLEGLLQANPCRKIDLPRLSKPDPRWLTRLEFDRLQMALGDMPRGHVWQALVGLGCFAGLRPGELAGLDVGAVDVDRRLVRVSQVQTRYGLRSYPKTDSSIRTVTYPVEVAEKLWPLVADRSEGPVFTSPRGSRVQFWGDWPRNVWHPALAAAGIEPVRPYAMRHTCASWLVQAGVSDRRIMQVLGHSDNHLIKVYAHLAPDEHDEVRAAWGEIPRPTSDPPILAEIPRDE